MLDSRACIKVPVACRVSFARALRTTHAANRLTCYAAAQTADTTDDSESGLIGHKCRDCDGTGVLAAGGYHKKNPLNQSKLVGSKWTARERTLGWRHFVVREKRKTDIANYALLVATCDSDAQLWVSKLSFLLAPLLQMNVHNLRERERWACGWLQKVQLQALDEPTGVACKTCGGTGLIKGFMQL